MSFQINSRAGFLNRMKPILQVQQIYYSRNDVPLLQDVHFDVCSGDVLQLVGLNGSGKTTILKLLAGLLKPEHGDVLWQGESIYKNPENYHPHVFYLGHQRGIKKDLTVFENLQLNWNQKKQSQDEIYQALDALNILSLADKALKYLSQGQQQRVALAKLKTTSAKLWLMDEPFSSLDGDGAILIEQLFTEHCTQGGTVIVSTHQPISWQKITAKLFQLRASDFS